VRKVRAARPGEVAACAALVAEAFQELRVFYRPTAAARRTRSSHKWSRLAAFEAGKLAGCCDFRIDGRILRIRALAVRRDVRRRGIGRDLIEALAQTARTRKCRALRLFAIRETGNEEVFRGLGFRSLFSRSPADFESPSGGRVTEMEMERELRREDSAWARLTSARGSAGLVRSLDRNRWVAPDLWRSLAAVTEGTHSFTHRIVREAATRLGRDLPPLPCRVPLATDRTDPAWYRTRARGGSVRLELLRAFKKLAVTRLPLLEAHLGRRESPLFLKGPSSKWDSRLPKHGVPAAEFRKAAKRWLNLMTAKATWLSLRLAEVAVKATGDPACGRETLRVCAAVASRPRLYDPFNTFAAFLEAFHQLAVEGPGPLSALLDTGEGDSPLARIALTALPGKRWRSTRARQLAATSRRPGGPSVKR
jgi:N-acetylglutamate synthase-like GNAT family acetyltransferase